MARGMNVVAGLAAIVLMVCSPVFAQSKKTANTLSLDKKENMPKATVADLAWLTGHWRGEGLGGQCEELWAPPVGDNLIGMFRFLKDGKTQFTELFSIVEEDGSLVLALKHFNRDMTGWEEKDEVVRFPLVRLSAHEANFAGLTYRRVDDDTLESIVVMKGKDGSLSELVFKFKRVKE